MRDSHIGFILRNLKRFRNCPHGAAVVVDWFVEQLWIEVENIHTLRYMCVLTFVELLHLGAVQGRESAETGRAFVVFFMPELWMFDGRLHQCWQVYVLALTH